MFLLYSLPTPYVSGDLLSSSNLLCSRVPSVRPSLTCPGCPECTCPWGLRLPPASVISVLISVLTSFSGPGSVILLRSPHLTLTHMWQWGDCQSRVPPSPGHRGGVATCRTQQALSPGNLKQSDKSWGCLIQAAMPEINHLPFSTPGVDGYGPF